ncbi:MAG: aminopeptidase [Crenarchaeota archaeon]|nr:aminopeptidase [Thermoproteota archaeon]
MPEWAWFKLNEDAIENFANDYKKFLCEAKTERETVKYLIKEAERYDFKPIDELEKLSVGDKVYATFRNKLVAMAVIGKNPVTKGFRIIGSHTDTPRIDLKPAPLYENSGIAMLKTHYYGGVKKYQWVAIPLALHGTIAFKDGTVKDIVIGEDDSDPIFVIPDVAPHIGGKKQESRKGTEVIEGEELHTIAGNKPIRSEKQDEKDSVKKMVLKILEEKYGIKEEDLISADLALVPAFKPRDAGFDRSMIAAYGQDDRVCVYTSFRALIEQEKPEFTAIGLFVDREEIGSAGDTSINSMFFEYFITEIMRKSAAGTNIDVLIKAFTNSRAISADVNTVVDPLHGDLYDLSNAGFLGKGVILTKYTGRGGKYSTSEAHAEYIAWIRNILDKRNIPWQSGLMGKVDVGGGGTIAMFIAQRGIITADMGPGVLALHAPYEITSKADVYSAYLAYKAFYEEGE